MSILLHLHPLNTRAAFSYWQHGIHKTTFQIFSFRTFVSSSKSNFIKSFTGPILDPSEFVQDKVDTKRPLGLPENNNPMCLAVRSRASSRDGHPCRSRRIENEPGIEVSVNDFNPAGSLECADTLVSRSSKPRQLTPMRTRQQRGRL